MTDHPDAAAETEETVLPALRCLYCDTTNSVYVRLFRWNGSTHLACHCRNCGHRWQMRERESDPADS